MRRLSALRFASVSSVSVVLAFGLALAFATPGRASSDVDCDPVLKLVHPGFLRCNSMVALGPGNDTRLNLLLLLFDRYRKPPDYLPDQPQPAKPLADDAVPLVDWREARDSYVATTRAGTPGFADGEGSRCRSDGPGTSAFETAINTAADVSADERTTLVTARKALKPDCATKDGGGTDLVLSVQSPAAQAFATYLQGTAAFYQGRFDAAREAFSKLHGAKNAWLANTADYMVARTEVNLLQLGAFNEYGDFAGSDHVDQQVATRAAASLDAYLREHPGGTYAGSARGLQRRVDWLAGRIDKLAAGYEALLAKAPADRDIDDNTLVEEIDSKLLPFLKPEMVHDPILLAVLDLKAMREPTRTVDTPPAVPGAAKTAERVDLAAQRTVFAPAPALLEFLMAVQAFYVEHDPAKVMKLLPDDTKRRDGDHLWFSRQFLRGLALEAKGDRNARGFWKEFFPGTARPLDRLTIQLALAMHDERASTPGDVFAAGSIVTSPYIRNALLEQIADAELLRRVVLDSAAPERERQIALETLLYKEVTRGRYTDFLADLAKVPAGLATEKNRLDQFTSAPASDLDCPALPETAKQLARDPQSVRGRLCLSEFVRSYGMPDEPASQPKADTLGGAPQLFAGVPYARVSTYKAVIADKAAPAEDRAYALYRAVMCYAPTSINECGGPTLPKAQRKAWYSALKRDYPQSRWAKELTYWW